MDGELEGSDVRRRKGIAFGVESGKVFRKDSPSVCSFFVFFRFLIRVLCACTMCTPQFCSAYSFGFFSPSHS